MVIQGRRAGPEVTDGVAAGRHGRLIPGITRDGRRPSPVESNAGRDARHYVPDTGDCEPPGASLPPGGSLFRGCCRPRRRSPRRGPRGVIPIVQTLQSARPETTPETRVV